MPKLTSLYWSPYDSANGLVSQHGKRVCHLKFMQLDDAVRKRCLEQDFLGLL